MNMNHYNVIFCLFNAFWPFNLSHLWNTMCKDQTDSKKKTFLCCAAHCATALFFFLPAERAVAECVTALVCFEPLTVLAAELELLQWFLTMTHNLRICACDCDIVQRTLQHL